MKRDLVCITRVLIDSLPKSIRNSRLLFDISKLIFDVPEILFLFRKKYDQGFYKDLSIFYSKNENFSLKISKETDINSLHLRLIKKILKKESPHLLLDCGAGSGFLLDEINAINPSIKLLGIDYQIS